jgi:hypothetical protein
MGITTSLSEGTEKVMVGNAGPTILESLPESPLLSGSYQVLLLSDFLFAVLPQGEIG